VATGFGPDGRPAVFENGGWVSDDRRYRWNGLGWTPIQTVSSSGPWLQRAGVVLLVLAAVGYLAYIVVANDEWYSLGFVVGVIAYFAVLLVIYKIAGRAGCFGAAVRVVVIALAVLRVVAMLRQLAG
jgi:hypothetical protein